MSDCACEQISVMKRREDVVIQPSDRPNQSQGKRWFVKSEQGGPGEAGEDLVRH